MKKEYSEAAVEVVKLVNNDIITASNNADNDVDAGDM
jgi:hypothetical protein